MRPVLYVLVAPAIAVLGCSHAGALRGRMRELRTMIDDAHNNGALACAPRELATASSQLEFAEIDLAQGELSSAWVHVEAAQPNAEAALLLSPPARCRLGVGGVPPWHSVSDAGDAP